jgi:glycosyltransferase involved in cell wall biosynthesis
MSKDIWYLSKYANVKKFGAETRQASFCKKFAENGYNVRLIISNSSHLYSTLPEIEGRYLEHKNDNYNVTWINTLKYNKATSIRRFISWFWFEFFVMLLPILKKYKKPDVIIASSLSIMSVLSGSFYKLFFKSKFIFEIRDIWPQTLIDLKGLSKRHPLIKLLSLVEKLGYKYSDVIVGTMPGLAEHVESVIGDSSKVHFIPQGVSLDFYRNEQVNVGPDYLNKYIPKNKFIVLYAGTFGVAYALNHVISAAKILESQDDNIHFVFLGNGLEEDKLKTQASGMKNITFAPRVMKEQVLSVLEIADVLLHSFKMEEVFKFGISPNKFVDYMYAKKPIVCMFSGHPSMINEANCGEFTPSEDPEALVDALIKYASMPKEQLDKLGMNGYNFLVEKRNFNVLAKQYMDLFND